MKKVIIFWTILIFNNLLTQQLNFFPHMKSSQNLGKHGSEHTSFQNFQMGHGSNPGQLTKKNVRPAHYNKPAHQTAIFHLMSKTSPKPFASHLSPFQIPSPPPPRIHPMDPRFTTMSIWNLTLTWTCSYWDFLWRSVLVSWLDKLVFLGQIDPKLKTFWSSSFLKHLNWWHLTVNHTRACSHPLHPAWLKYSTIASTVQVTHFTCRE